MCAPGEERQAERQRHDVAVRRPERRTAATRGRDRCLDKTERDSRHEGAAGVEPHDGCGEQSVEPVPGCGVDVERRRRRSEDRGEPGPDTREGEGDPDEQIGVNIVRRALEEPLRQIVQNAGKEGAVVVERVRSDKGENFGFNAQTEEYGDLVKAGVIDPAKVTRTALQNAASIAGLMLTTEAMVSEIPDDDKGSPAMPGGMGGMSGMGM